MTNKEILNITLQQSAYDCSCEPQDFMKDENVVVLSKENKNAKKNLPLPFECNLTSYGNNVVAQVSEEFIDNFLSI